MLLGKGRCTHGHHTSILIKKESRLNGLKTFGVVHCIMVILFIYGLFSSDYIALNDRMINE
jgi:hypothetical protein